jgi:uncharacterized SAM-binding protein YcdF (DUF218 family)
LGSRKFLFLKWVVFIAALSVIVILHAVWLSALGDFLVRAQPPEKAELAVVLGGDFYGNRILKAAELVHEGYVPKVLVSGPDGIYGNYECDLAIPFAVKKGYPKSWFIPFPIKAYSTEQEALAILPELQRRHIRKFLLVTSNYHTRRAASVYKSLAGDYEFRTIAAPDEFFQAARWWRTREGQKTFLLEWLKTFAYWVGF